ncbi:MAG TPA: glycosyltransferase family 2 protein [Candidatus Limnocylindrales bacterium]
MLPSVTLVVAMRNEAASIEACLRSLLAQDWPEDRLELLVMDGRSTDDSRAIAERLLAGRPNARVLDNERIIQAAAWNQGIDLAAGDIVGIVSGHAELDPGYVAAAVRTLEETGATLVGGPVVAIGEGPIGEAVAIATSTPFGVGGARHHYVTERAEVDTVFMGLARREDYARLKFDETMVRNQDDELSYRILDEGGRIVCDPAMRSRYRNRSTLAGLWRQQFAYGSWKIRVFQQHPRQARLRHLVPAAFVGALAGSSLLAGVSSLGRAALVATVVTYGAADLGASALGAARAEADPGPGDDGGTTRPGGRLGLFARLAVVYPTIHLAYGLGGFAGLVRFRDGWRRRGEPAVDGN